MRRDITGAEFDLMLATYQQSAFRLEQQPQYAVTWEAEHVAAYAAGTPLPATDLPELQEWYAQVSRQTSAGRPMARVRIHEDPPTDYQRWVRWIGNDNVKAGETLHYLTRPAAIAAGITPDLGDWWLIDDDMVILFEFDNRGRPARWTLTDDTEAVELAKHVRDKALAAAR